MQLGNYVHGVDTFSRVGIDIETESSDGCAALNHFRFPVLIRRSLPNKRVFHYIGATRIPNMDDHRETTKAQHDMIC